MLQIKYFGMIAEAIGKETEELNIESKDVGNFIMQLKKKYHKLDDYNFKIAVNQNIVEEEFLLKGDEEIAVLPPFAGG